MAADRRQITQYGEPETGRNGGSAPVQSFLTDQAQNLLSGSAQAAQEAEKFRPLRDAAVQAAGNHQNGCQHHKDREKKGNLVNPGHGGPFQLPLETQKTGMNVNLFIGKLILLLYLCDHLCDGAKIGENRTTKMSSVSWTHSDSLTSGRAAIREAVPESIEEKAQCQSPFSSISLRVAP